MPVYPDRRQWCARTALFLVGLLLAGPGWTHAGHAHAGWTDGLLHPLNGLDHLLAMIGVGLWAAWQRVRALQWLPLGFVTAAAAGTLLGSTLGAAAAPGIETGVALTLLALGAALLARWHAPASLAWSLVILCGALHGAAHGGEMGVQGWAPVLGFLGGTALLHAAGYGLLRASRPVWRAWLVTGGGIGSALAGTWLLA